MADNHEEQERQRRAREIFNKASRLPTDERLPFVEKVCGDDPPLADEVMQMIQSAQDAKTSQVREQASPQDEEPKQIGLYKILDTLGEGGMGTVYLVEQREPVRRRLALKVMKRGLDSKIFLARFAAERQAMAMMEHTCIAKVFDAGLTETGQPFLVMEHVKGVPITDYCDDNKLSIAQRVELFMMVCSAIQHAHNKGVMHRDLKPSNILVSVQDGEPHPKIIDFGLAKATDHRLVEATVFTEKGQIIGTPEYMSPEQAGVGGLDIDTRTDVFSLGVLLYQLLTGSLPVTREELLKHGWFEMQRFIREGELQKPSTKITTLGDGAAAFAKARRVPLGELQKKLRGELDWIVMKAIEKDRGRRYTTVHELAADLLHHLNDEPVNAGPPSARYLLSKVLKRYRGAAVTGVLVFVALGVGLGVALWQRGIAVESEEEAKVQTVEANKARSIANQERQRAEELFSKYERLADAVRLRTFERRANALWPECDAKKIAMAKWVDDAKTWLAGMPDHAETLVQLRRKGSSDGNDWKFENASEQFLHDALSDLVPMVAAFRGEGGLLAQVTASRDWSRVVFEKTVEDEADAWRRAKEAVRSHPDFDKLPLKSQEGLIPLGTNQHGLEEFLLGNTGEPPVAGKEGVDGVSEETGVVLVLLPGGMATIGSMAGFRNEQPVHEVELAPFFLAKYELTQGQWERWGGAPLERWRAGNRPIIRVNWYEAEQALRMRGLLMPTEAQWEYACRAGSTTEWFFGADRAKLLEFEGGVMNIATKPIPGFEDWPEYEDHQQIIGPVGLYRPNSFGLFDMHGNVAEYVRGEAIAYQADSKFHAPDDGMIGTDEGPTGVQRGGSWWKPVADARSACRVYIGKDDRLDSTGIRITRALDR